MQQIIIVTISLDHGSVRKGTEPELNWPDNLLVPNRTGIRPSGLIMVPSFWKPGLVVPVPI